MPYTSYFLRRCVLRIAFALPLAWNNAMTNAAYDVPRFNLKSPGEYFSNLRTRELIDAALAGNLSLSQQLAKNGADPNEEGPQGKPNRIRPLHYAAAAGNMRAIQILGSLGADPELNAKGFGSALAFVVTLDMPEMLDTLLELRPVSALAKDSLEYLIAAVMSLPRPRCLVLLLKRGVSVDWADSAGNTLFMEALSFQDLSLAEWLLQQGASAVREPTVAGMTPANTLQFHIAKYVPGSPTHSRLLQIKKLMEAKGASFPAPTPKEIRGQR